MEKKVLIALDDSLHSKHAVRYAAETAQSLPGIRFSLLHVLPPVSQYLTEEARQNPKAKAELNRWLRKSDQAARQMLEEHKETMARLDVSADHIETTVRIATQGAAKDILAVAETLPYDAVILGRRGMSGVQEIFTGSVSADVLEKSVQTPIWLVDEKAPANGVLVAVDGSDSALKAVDHLAFMSSGNRDVQVCLFHVTPRLGDACPVGSEGNFSQELGEIVRRGNRKCIDGFLPRAIKIFADAGIHESQVNSRVVKGGMRVGKAILGEFRRERYGTLVIGRRGMSRKLFTGSVSRYLINRFSGGSLWVVP